MTIDLGPVSEFPESGHKVVQGENQKPIAVFKVGEAYFGVEELCPHRGGPLSEGKVDPSGCVTCPWHDAKFELATGKPLKGPVHRNLKTYAVYEKDKRLVVRVQ